MTNIYIPYPGIRKAISSTTLNCQREKNTLTDFTILELKLEILGPQDSREERGRGGIQSLEKKHRLYRLWT